MGKAPKDVNEQERTVSSASQAEPPLTPAIEGPLSPTRSTNIAESSREPEGRLPAADELEDQEVQRLAVLKRIQQLELEGALPERRDAAKARKKLVRDVQSLISDTTVTADVKVTRLQDRLLELVSTQARSENELIPLRKQASQALREKEEARAEAQRAVSVNTKLQELCRTLQQQNKAVVEQAKATVGQEQLSRQEFTERVGETLKSVTLRIEEQTKERDMQMKENGDLRERLIEFDEKWTQREELFQKQLEAKGLECSLWAERAREAGEKEGALQEQLQATREQVSQTSAMMEQHLSNYAQYQATITQSNQVLQQLQADDKRKDEAIALLEKAKRIRDKHLKQERARADRATDTLEAAVQRSTHLAKLVEVAGGKQQLQEVPKLRVQKQTLEKLCRTLQDESHQLKTQLCQDHPHENGVASAPGMADEPDLAVLPPDCSNAAQAGMQGDSNLPVCPSPAGTDIRQSEQSPTRAAA